MVAWAGTASRREVRAAAPRLREIPLALRAQQEARHARADRGAASGQLPLAVRASAPLWALAAERCARAEAGLLLPLARLALRLLHGELGAPAALGGARAVLAEAAADLADEIVERTARSPLDAAAVQTLAWRLEGSSSSSSSTTTTTIAAADTTTTTGGGGGGVAAAAEGAWLAGALCTLSVAWHRRTWLDGAAEATALLSDSAATLACGPVRLLLSTQTPLVAARLLALASSALSERDAALAQLAQLRQVMVSVMDRVGDRVRVQLRQVPNPNSEPHLLTLTPTPTLKRTLTTTPTLTPTLTWCRPLPSRATAAPPRRRPRRRATGSGCCSPW